MCMDVTSLTYGVVAPGGAFRCRKYVSPVMLEKTIPDITSDFGFRGFKTSNLIQ